MTKNPSTMKTTNTTNKISVNVRILTPENSDEN